MKRVRLYKTMQGIGALRLHLGLTQEAFAIELGISRSLVSKVENKNRTLPTPALVKLVALHARMTANSRPATTDAPAAEAAAQPAEDLPAGRVLSLARKLEREADLLQHRLHLMAASYRHLFTCLENVEWLLHGPTNTDSNNGSLYLKIQRSIIIRKMTRCNASMQARLQKKIALLRAAAAMK